MRSPNVPYLSAAQLDAAVKDLVIGFERWLSRAVAPPIPIEDIVEKYLGVTLEMIDLEAKLGVKDVLGAAYFNEGIIRIEEGLLEKEGRFSFTVGHEIGHWCLHRPLYKASQATQPLFNSGQAEPDIVCRSSSPKPSAEIQADAFASRLLMPERFVREAFQSGVGADPVVIEGLDARGHDRNTLSRWQDLAATIIADGNFTNVSNEAMRYRLKDLGLVCARAAAIRSLF